MSDTAATTQSPETEAPKRGLSLLAHEYYGDSFHGDVKEEPSDNEPITEEDKPEENDTEEVEEGAGVKPDEGEEDAEVPISSVEELIENQEWDRDWFNSLDIPIKVDGEPAKAKLSDLVANYQMNKAADKRLEDAKAKAKSQTEEFAKKQQELEGQFVTAAKLIENAEKLLDSESSNVDWSVLKADDPAEYSAKKIEFQERKDAIEKAKREAVESYQKSTEERMKEAQEDFGKRIQQEQELLLDKLPEWRDQAKAKEEQSQISKYLMNQGFSEQDVQGASDHRLIVLARKAMLFDQGQSKADAAKKKVRTVPKVMKPGTPKPQEQANKEKADKARARLRQSGSLDDAFALLRAKKTGG